MTNILNLQKCLLSKDNNTTSLMDVTGLTSFLAELSQNEGDLIPFTIRTGPMGKPDHGLLKRYEGVEINGEGMAYVMVWIQGRLVAWGTLFAQETPKHPRRLTIKRELRIGYDIDLFIAHQGELTGFEVFYDLLEGDEE